MDGTGDLFQPFIDALGEQIEAHVVRYPTNQALGYESLIELAKSELPTTRPYVLLGESFSGPIAISIAAARPKNLVGLILVCTFAKSPLPFLSPLSKLIDWMPVTRTPNLLLEYALMGKDSTPQLNAPLQSALSQLSAAVMRTRARAALTFNVETELANIGVPILFLRAARDRIIPRRVADDMKRVISQLHIVDFDAPHFLLQTRPQQAAVAIRPMLDNPQSIQS